jgi:MYXO-CTERM domain-containing protein
MTLASARRLVLVVLVAGALCAPAIGASAQVTAPPPPPGLGVKLLQGPADSADDPRTHEYIVDHLAPGTTISRQIGFSNGESEPSDLSFYAAAADIHDGRFVPGAGHAANELTSWTTFSPTSATLAPGEILPVTVTIAVPPDATAGERYAAALAENSPPPSPGGGVTSVSRVGIRIYLSVGPGGAAVTSFSIDSMTAQRDADGIPFVTAQVHNTGERAIDLSGQLALTNGPAALSAGPFPLRTVATLAVGGSGTVTVLLDPGLPNGPWDGRITLESGKTSETVTGRLMFPSENGTSAVPTTDLRSGTDGSRMMVFVITLGLLLALLLLLVAVRRRRKDDPVLVAAARQG